MLDFLPIHKSWRDPVPSLSKVLLLIIAALILELAAVFVRNQVPRIPPPALLAIVRALEVLIFLLFGPWSVRSLLIPKVVSESILIAVICSLAGILSLAGWKLVVGTSLLRAGSGLLRKPLIIQVLFYATACLISPVAEELLFRGLLFRKLRDKWGFPVCTLAISLLFALIHFCLIRTPMSALMPFLGSLLFCAGYEKTKSILAPILLHISGNLIIYLSPLIPFV